MVSNLSASFYFALGFGSAWIIIYFMYRRRINRQAKKTIQLLKADEIKLNQPEDLYEHQETMFADLERASVHLRRKYLRLKKNSLDERAAYEAIFSGLKEAVVTLDPQFKIISFNTAFMQQFKWSPLSGGVPNTSYFLHDVIREPSVIDALKNLFQDRRLRYQDFDQFQLFASVLPAVEDHSDWAIAVFYDRSEIQRTEKIRVDFVANASHELRTPLTVISGYADLLKTKLKDTSSDVSHLVNPILEATQSMILLLDDLLNLSKLDHSDKLTKEFLDVREVTQSVLDELDEIAKMNKKIIHTDFQIDRVHADRSSLEQILRNLIVNAIRYSGGQSPDIRVSWVRRRNSDSQDCAVLIVRDYGQGISKEHQERIFERFYRIDKGRSRALGGSGLGLALVKHHILNHGGRVSLQSNQGEGSEFVCEFPE